MATVEAGAWGREEGCLRRSPMTPQALCGAAAELCAPGGSTGPGALGTLRGRVFGTSLWRCVPGWRADMERDVSQVLPQAEGSKLPKQTLEKGRAVQDPSFWWDPRRRSNRSQVRGSRLGVLGWRWGERGVGEAGSPGGVGNGYAEPTLCCEGPGWQQDWGLAFEEAALSR